MATAPIISGIEPGPDDHRPLGHVLRDIKKVDDEMIALRRKREALTDELFQLQEAVNQAVSKARAA